MQFVAEDPVYVSIRPESEPLFDTSGRQVSVGRRHVFAKFKRGTAPEWARSEALKLFEFRKLPDTGVSIDQWIAFYDSVEDQHEHGWTDEEREVIEQELASTHSVVRIEAPKPPLPYPAFERHRRVHGQRKIEHAISDIVNAVQTSGFDPEAVIAYEASNQNDPRLIEALHALHETETEAEDEPLIAA